MFNWLKKLFTKEKEQEWIGYEVSWETCLLDIPHGRGKDGRYQKGHNLNKNQPRVNGRFVKNKEFVIYYINNNLDDYRLFVQHCDKYNDNNISEIIELIKEDRIKSECIVNLFRYTFVNNVLKDVFKRCPILDEFNYKLHENNLEQFKKLDLKKK